MDLPTILIVEDEQDYAEFVRSILEQTGSIAIVNDGKSAIEFYEEHHPDLVLLDINLPDIDGFEVCKTIKQLDSADNTSIIFVSGINSVEEKITGYEAGGDDYISKPFQLNEFTTKISTICRYQQTKKSLTKQEVHARNIAFESMKEASQYGQVLQFLKASFSCNNIFTLTNALFDTLSSFQLNCCIQIRLPSQDISMRPHNRSCSPMEDELFGLLKSRGRLFEFGSRLMVNDIHASILIKNMPNDDLGETGRLKDIVAVIIEGFEARLLDIERKSGIKSIVSALKSTTVLAKEQFNEHERKNVSIMDNLLLDMGGALHTLALTEEQENFFMSLVQKAMVELVDVCEHGKLLGNELEKVNQLTKTLLD